MGLTTGMPHHMGNGRSPVASPPGYQDVRRRLQQGHLTDLVWYPHQIPQFPRLSVLQHMHTEKGATNYKTCLKLCVTVVGESFPWSERPTKAKM